MTPAEADWVATAVLPKWIVAGAGGIELIRFCSCQYGQCGRCAMGKHAKCTTRARPSRPDSAARIIGRRGGVVADVWPTGTPCAWRCPCDCPTPEPEPLGLPADAPTQLALFDMAGAP